MRPLNVVPTQAEAARSAPAGKEPGPAAKAALELMQGWTWFAYVPAEAREWLAARASLRRFDKGDTVFMDGDPAAHVFGVVSGVFRIYLATHKGDEITMEEVVAGGWFPHVVPDERPRYVANCVCQQGATVAVLPQPALAEFARQWPGYYRGLYHEFTSRWVAVSGRIELLSLHNLNVRLAVYILRMLRLRGQPEPQGPIFLPAFDSQTEVGARVGGTRQRVNSILKTWTRRGLIEPHKDGIRVLNIDGLTAEARKTGFDIATYLAGWHYGWQGKSAKPAK